jgi:hypothetical protein
VPGSRQSGRTASGGLDGVYQGSSRWPTDSVSAEPEFPRYAGDGRHVVSSKMQRPARSVRPLPVNSSPTSTGQSPRSSCPGRRGRPEIHSGACYVAVDCSSRRACRSSSPRAEEETSPPHHNSAARHRLCKFARKSLEPSLTIKVVNTTISSCSTSKSSMIRQRRRWLWSPCGVDSSPS